MAQHFQFELYRINIVDTDPMFPDFGQRIRSDEQILAVLQKVTSSDFDLTQETKKAEYKWSVREFTDYGQIPGRGRVASVVLAKSTLKKDGMIVTDERIISGTSDSFPPLASMMMLFFDMDRHLVAAEYHGELSQNKIWKSSFLKILLNAAYKMQMSSSLLLEEVPEKHEIVKLFRSFERLTRLKVYLRLPNPELSRYTKSIYEDLENGSIREYLQDMKNPGGLSKNEQARPFASVALAEEGYKSGEVLFEGIKEGRFTKVRSSEEAARGKLEILKDYVRGISANAKAKEAQQVLSAITAEIDRLHPKED
ncbi:MAG: hypothetical protein FP814_02265 [Desulfobacterium sp.]|nr:hypothetical protein [Desulfobacterium sp.]MBU3949079.1 hypothetical protein [Pseudomonadota bacterium]MBU4009775.1 hypothetical protein [Pseudomonadota bacterium]MBU4037480.1 hypothetical protein [Pseudomonadota bacterium]